MLTSNSLDRLSLTGVDVSLDDLIALQYVANVLPALPSANITSSQYGGHISKLKGRGVEFNEVRAYQSGDDIKSMDWKITARTGKAHTKLFHDERQRPIYLLVDDRANMDFGTKVAFKSVIAAQIAGIFAWMTMQNGDRLGAVISNGIEAIELRPNLRGQGLLPIFTELAKKDRLKGSGYLVDDLIRLRHVVNPGSLIFIISDFNKLGDGFEKHLSILRQHNEVVSCFVYDEFEKTPPTANSYQVSDGEKWLGINTGNKYFCDEYKKIFKTRYDQSIEICNRWNIPMLEFATHQSVSKVLLHAFGRV